MITLYIRYGGDYFFTYEKEEIIRSIVTISEQKITFYQPTFMNEYNSFTV